METKKMSLASIQGKLSRVEMKQIMGGWDEELPGDDAGCKGLYCLDNGYESCWYSSSGNINDLCRRVYPHCQMCSGGSVPCGGCHM